MDNFCIVEGCTHEVLAKGFCRAHYQRVRAGRPLESPIRNRSPKGTVHYCSMDGCTRRVVAGMLCNAHYIKKRQEGTSCKIEGCGRQVRALGFCDGHYLRFKKNLPLDVPLRIVGQDRGCIVKDCLGRHFAHNMCRTHRRRFVANPLTYDRPVKQRRRRSNGWSTKDGYRFVIVNGDYVFEHRHIMEQSLGRRLLEGENVHHKNGNRSDNRLVKGHEISCPSTCCNLELWSRQQPAGQRIADKITQAKALLEQYERKD